MLKSVSGSQSAIWGKTVMIAAAQHIRIKKGAAAIATFVMGVPVNPWIINKLN